LTQINKSKPLTIGFICNYSVDLHFPVHFHGVYCTLLPQKGYHTDIVAFFRDENATMTRLMKKKGVALIPNYKGVHLINRMSHSIFVIFKLIGFFLSRPVLRKADIYVVHNDPLLGWVTYFWALMQSRPVIYRITHLMPEQAMNDHRYGRRIAGRVAKRLRNWLILRCNLVLPMSREMAKTLSQQVESASNRMLPVESTVNIGDITEKPDSKQAQLDCITDLKHEMADFPCRKWLVYIGTLSPFRKPTFIFKTLAEVRKNGIDAGLLILGIAQESWHVSNLKSFAEKVGVREYILWSEGVPENCLPDAIALADIGLSPFPMDFVMSNNSPLKTLEYIKGGVPLVASPIPDHLDVVPNSGIGLVVDFDPKAFAKACVFLLNESKAKRKNRVDQAQEWLKENRSLSYACKRLEVAFNQCRPFGKL